MTPQKSKTIYMQVKERALPLMTHYQTDLTKHDRNALRNHDGTPFLHFTRETATHIVFFDSADSEKWPPHGERVKYLFGTADRYHILNELMATPNHYDDPLSLPCKLVLYFDGYRLKEIDTKQAIAITQQYIADIKRQWDNS